MDSNSGGIVRAPCLTGTQRAVAYLRALACLIPHEGLLGRLATRDVQELEPAVRRLKELAQEAGQSDGAVRLLYAAYNAAIAQCTPNHEGLDEEV